MVKKFWPSGFSLPGKRLLLVPAVLMTLMLSAMPATVGVAATETDILLFLPAILSGIKKPQAGIHNGWFVRPDGTVIWGYIGHNSWWGTEPLEPNITRIGGGNGPLHTVEISPFIDSMLKYGFPGFEHNFGLWYDRRRDSHGTSCRTNNQVVGPLLIQPWARSGIGQACDGETLYDLEQFNQAYFDRLAEFAEVAHQKGAVFINNHYMQHALMEIDAHYVDFPWRPGNNIQNVLMPNNVPAAHSFNSVSDPLKLELHTAYINKILDSLGDYPNVVHMIGHQYTGNLAFMQFWIDTIKTWQNRHGKRLHIALGGTKDVEEAILADPLRALQIDTINLQYWWYQADGSLLAPPGGKNIAGRYSSGFLSSQTSYLQIYRQVREYRDRYPDKALLHKIDADRLQTWAFLMGGGAMLIRYMTYASPLERAYVAPVKTAVIKHTYEFINTSLALRLPDMLPRDLILNSSNTVWCLADKGSTYLFYAPAGGNFTADLSSSNGQFTATWFNPQNGAQLSAGTVDGGASVYFATPSSSDWALLLKK